MDLLFGAVNYAFQMYELGDTIGGAVADGAIDGGEGVSILTSTFHAATAAKTLNNRLGGATTTSNAVSATTPTFSTVEWTASSLRERVGMAKVPDSGLAKCDAMSFFSVGDIVKAKSDLTWSSGKKVTEATLGTLKSLEGNGLWVVEWWQGIGELHANQTTLQKCKPSEYFVASDIIKAKFDLSWSSLGKRVAKGTLGTLKSKDGELWLVRWCDGTGELKASKEQFEKCEPMQYFLTSDIVKAKYDLSWPSGVRVAQGTLGTLKSFESNNVWVVNWSNTIGELNTNQSSLQKCLPSDYWQKGDMLVTTRDFTFDNGEITVPKGTLCRYQKNA
jgi:hypothetical protein